MDYSEDTTQAVLANSEKALALQPHLADAHASRQPLRLYLRSRQPGLALRECVIIAAALRKGLVSESEAREMSHKEIGAILGMPDTQERLAAGTEAARVIPAITRHAPRQSTVTRTASRGSNCRSNSSSNRPSRTPRPPGANSTTNPPTSEMAVAPVQIGAGTGHARRQVARERRRGGQRPTQAGRGRSGGR